MQQASFDAALPVSHIAGLERRPLLWIGVLALALFILRLSAPPNLLDQDQENPGTYVLDVVKNGNWICQRDLSGNIASKPPLYTWLAALITMASGGRISLIALYLPGAAALAGTAFLVFQFGRVHFGGRVALVAALACMLCTAGLKQFGLARTDGVFAFMVTAAAFAGYRAWIRGGGWTWFWLLASAATLTKGPLGLVLASGGLLSSRWERRSGEPLPMRGSHLLGITLFVLITAGWLALATMDLGRPVIDRLLLRELIFHAVEGEHRTVPGSLFYLSPLYYLARAAPWSLFAYAGLWRVWKHPAADAHTRRAERFLFCWFALGLFLFSMSPHQRGDLLWPIIPAGALAAAREVTRLRWMEDPVKANRVLAWAVAVALAGFTIFYFGPRSSRPLVQQTILTRQLAAEIERQAGPEFPITHTDDPAALQIYLNTYCPRVPMEEAAEQLRGSEPAFVAVSDLNRLHAARTPDDPPLYSLLESRGPVDKLNIHIVGNRSRFVPRGQ